jgi:hypothetical protein
MAAFCRHLEAAGLGEDLERDGMEQLGFFVCTADLEDEPIRALGIGRVRDVIAAQGEHTAFDTFRKQPAQRGRAVDAQLRRVSSAHALVASCATDARWWMPSTRDASRDRSLPCLPASPDHRRDRLERHSAMTCSYGQHADLRARASHEGQPERRKRHGCIDLVESIEEARVR